MADNIDVAQVVGDLVTALDNMNIKLDKMQEDSFYIDEFKKSKNAKFKTFADLIKKEFKDYLKNMLSSASGIATSKTGKQEGQASDLVEAGAEKIGGPISKVRVEEINPAVFKMLRDLLRDAFKQKEEKEEIKKKSGFGWVFGLLALLGGVIAGVIEWIRERFLMIKSMLKGLKIFEWIADGFRFLRSRIFAAAEFIYKQLKETKLFKSLERIWEGIIASIRESSFVKKLRAFFSEESFVGRLFKNMGAFFKGEGRAGGVVRSIGRVFEIMKNALRGVGGVIKSLIGAVKGAGAFVMNLIKRSPMFAIGKTIGRLLGPLFIVFELITNTIDSIKQQGFTFKAVLDGVLGGLLSFFTLGILNFENIKKLTDQISAAFQEGNFVEGILRILLGIPDLLFQGIGKIATWISGFFGDDIKKKVENFFNVSFTDKVLLVIKDVMNILLWPINKTLEILKNVFNIDVVKWLREHVPAPLLGIFDKIVKGATDTKERPAQPMDQTKLDQANIAKEEQKAGSWFDWFNKKDEEQSTDIEKVEDENYTEDDEYTKTSDLPIVTTNEAPELTAKKLEQENIFDSDKIIEVLQEQLEIMTQTKNYLENLKSSNNVATSVNNQSVVNMSGNTGVSSWRQGVIAR